MAFLSFEQNSLVVNLAIFAVVAAVVWFAGTRISFFADTLADRTGLGKAFMGLLFLALATSAPEIGTTISASVRGNAQLAINNIFGGVTMQTAILAVADVALVHGAITFFTPKPVLLLQGVLLIVLLALALAAVAADELGLIGHVGLSAIFLLGAYIVSLYLAQRYENRQMWDPKDAPSKEERFATIALPKTTTLYESFQHWSTRRLSLSFALGALVILIAGVVLAQVSEAVATQSGLGISFVGATLLATSTSLPEVSTTFAAIRVGSYSMAFSNIFGSNSLMMLLIFISDLFYRDGPILVQTQAPARFMAAMGIVVTAIYLAGLIERRNRTILRMGVDSALVLVLYLGSLVVLYQLR